MKVLVTGGNGFIERHKGFIKQKKIRLHREGAGDSSASGESQRQLAWIPCQMRTQPEYLDQFRQVSVGIFGRQCKPDVLLDRAPGQKAGLLENKPETAGSGCADITAEIRIDPGRDLQNRRLAATGRTDQRSERAGFEPKFQTAHDFNRRAVGR